MIETQSKPGPNARHGICSTFALISHVDNLPYEWTTKLTENRYQSPLGSSDYNCMSLSTLYMLLSYIL